MRTYQNAGTTYQLVISLLPAGWFTRDLFGDHFPVAHNRVYRQFFCGAANRRVACCAPAICHQNCNMYERREFAAFLSRQ